MPKYRKRPIVVEAAQFTEGSKDMVCNWVGGLCDADTEEGRPVLRIQTLEGEMTAQLGDWVIKGVQGEFYPCKPDIFGASYEPVEAQRRGVPGMPIIPPPPPRKEAP